MEFCMGSLHGAYSSLCLGLSRINKWNLKKKKQTEKLTKKPLLITIARTVLGRTEALNATCKSDQEVEVVLKVEPMRFGDIRCIKVKITKIFI